MCYFRAERREQTRVTTCRRGQGRDSLWMSSQLRSPGTSSAALIFVLGSVSAFCSATCRGYRCGEIDGVLIRESLPRPSVRFSLPVPFFSTFTTFRLHFVFFCHVIDTPSTRRFCLRGDKLLASSYLDHACTSTFIIFHFSSFLHV